MEVNSKAKPFYKPWIGDNFEGDSRRLLILGESHYGKGADNPNATRELTECYLSGKMNYAFWTNVQNVVSPSSLTEKERSKFWHSVAFYNYVQETAGDTAGVSPRVEAFGNSKSAFFTVLDCLKPRAILVLSTRLWNNLPGSSDGAEPTAPLVAAGKERDAWVYHYEGGSALASWIPHPSRYFAVSRWRPWVKALIDRTS